MKWPKLTDAQGRPRLLETDRPPGEDAPGPVVAATSAVLGLVGIVLFLGLAFDSSAVAFTRIGGLVGAIAVAVGTIRVILTWHHYRGRRSAFEGRA